MLQKSKFLLLLSADRGQVRQIVEVTMTTLLLSLFHEVNCPQINLCSDVMYEFFLQR